MIRRVAAAASVPQADPEPYHHGDLARALVQAARQQIEAQGLDRMSLRDAARATGVSVAAPYRHFKDRDTLLAAVLTEGFDELAEATESARRAAPDALAALRAVGQAYVAFATQHSAIYRLMFGPACQKARHPRLLGAGQRARGVLIDAVRNGQSDGVVRAGDPALLALAGWSLCHGLASLHADGLLNPPEGGAPPDPHALADALVDTLLGGIVG